MTANRVRPRASLKREQIEKWLLSGTLVLVVGAVTMSPFLMANLSSEGLPWQQLADIGQTYGGASALLSAVALCGVVASLLFQRRQVRQGLVEMDRHQHFEIMRIALERPELIEVLDARNATNPHADKELFANLMMMYWLAVWELGAVDEAELRAMAVDMFASETARRWWSRVGGVWIGTHGRRERRRFISIISAALAEAQRTPAISTTSSSSSPDNHVDRTHPRDGSRDIAMVALTAAVAGLSAIVAQSFIHGRRKVRVGKIGRT